MDNVKMNKHKVGLSDQFLKEFTTKTIKNFEES